MHNWVDLPVNKTNFHMKGFTQGLEVKGDSEMGYRFVYVQICSWHYHQAHMVLCMYSLAHNDKTPFHQPK